LGEIKEKNAMIEYRRLFGFVALTVAVVVLVGASAGASAGDASEGGDKTCTGGSIAPGVYSNLKITGVCTVDAGRVEVKHNVTVLSGGALIALYGGTDKMHVGSNLNVSGNVGPTASSSWAASLLIRSA
jgi:hypothetical protein